MSRPPKDEASARSRRSLGGETRCDEGMADIATECERCFCLLKSWLDHFCFEMMLVLIKSCRIHDRKQRGIIAYSSATDDARMFGSALRLFFSY